MLTGARLRRLRQAKDLTQQNMARMLVISQPAYCKLEQSREIDGERMQQIYVILNAHQTSDQYLPDGRNEIY